MRPSRFRLARKDHRPKVQPPASDGRGVVIEGLEDPRSASTQRGSRPPRTSGRTPARCSEPCDARGRRSKERANPPREQTEPFRSAPGPRAPCLRSTPHPLLPGRHSPSNRSYPPAHNPRTELVGESCESSACIRPGQTAQIYPQAGHSVRITPGQDALIYPHASLSNCVTAGQAALMWPQRSLGEDPDSDCWGASAGRPRRNDCRDPPHPCSFGLGHGQDTHRTPPRDHRPRTGLESPVGPRKSGTLLSGTAPDAPHIPRPEADHAPRPHPSCSSLSVDRGSRGGSPRASTAPRVRVRRGLSRPRGVPGRIPRTSSGAARARCGPATPRQ